MHIVWGLLAALLYLALTIVALIVGIVLLFIVCNAIARMAAAFKKQLGPRCPSCSRKPLDHLNYPFSDSAEYQYYRCDSCWAHFKRSTSGELIPHHPRVATDEEREALYTRRVSIMRPAKGGDSEDPLGSWFGSVLVALADEGWPMYQGEPMLPLCQLRCDEIPALPSALANMALICVFIASAGQEALSPRGERWVVRTYSSLDSLVPIAYPGEDAVCVRSYRAEWDDWTDDVPGLKRIPEELWIDYMGRKRSVRGTYGSSKVGGYGWDARDVKASREQLDAEFMFQIVSFGDLPWLRGPGGTFAFARSRESTSEAWYMSVAEYGAFRARFGKPVKLGCELAGVRIFLHRPYQRDTGEQLAMAYGRRSGRIFSLCDLRGLVRITTSEKALRFVRLRTCGFLNDHKADEREVLTLAEFAAQPAWYRSWPMPRRFVGDLLDRTCLDPDTFQLLGFEPALVTPGAEGFIVTRWTYTHTLRGGRYGKGEVTRRATYQKIHESVAPDGTYTRKVLEQRLAPDDELLRPSDDAGQNSPDELVRPVDEPDQDNPDEMLRPD